MQGIAIEQEAPLVTLEIKMTCSFEPGDESVTIEAVPLPNPKSRVVKQLLRGSA